MTAEPSGRQQQTAQEAVARAFGAENRARLLVRYFNAAGDVSTGNAWQHVYRLLLWIDRTTALAHCYESDKAQPGRAWYARTLAFHSWISEQLSTTPANLGDQIDWLFREAVKDLANKNPAARTATYTTQRAPYEGRGVWKICRRSEISTPRNRQSKTMRV